MSGRSDRKTDVDETLRLVSINADALLKTSSTARSVLGVEGSWQLPGRDSGPDVCASSSKPPSALKSAITTMLLDHKLSDACLPVTRQNETSSAVTVATSELPTKFRVVEENRTHSDSVTSSDQASTPFSITGTSTPLLTQSTVANNAVESNDTSAGISDDPVTNKPTNTIHTPPSAASSQSPCKNLPAMEVSEQPELLEKNFQLIRTNAVSIYPMQTTSEYSLDDSEKDVVKVSSDSCGEPCDGKLSLLTQHLRCSDEGITDQMESNSDNIETTTANQLQKTVVSPETDGENDQPAEVEMELGPTEMSGEQHIPVQNCAVPRNDTKKTVLQKPSRIVSFTTEDFDLFQSKYVA